MSLNKTLDRMFEEQQKLNEAKVKKGDIIKMQDGEFGIVNKLKGRVAYIKLKSNPGSFHPTEAERITYKGKFKGKDLYSETEEIDEANTTVDAGGEYNTKYAFGKKKKKDSTVGLMGYTQVEESTFMKMAKLTMINEVNYNEYKKDETASSKQKVNRAIKEVNSRLFKIERIISQNIKLKTETGIDENKYWKSTRENLSKISEKMERLSNKLRRF